MARPGNHQHHLLSEHSPHPDIEAPAYRSLAPSQGTSRGLPSTWRACPHCTLRIHRLAPGSGARRARPLPARTLAGPLRARSAPGERRARRLLPLPERRLHGFRLGGSAPLSEGNCWVVGSLSNQMARLSRRAALHSLARTRILVSPRPQPTGLPSSSLIRHSCGRQAEPRCGLTVPRATMPASPLCLSATRLSLHKSLLITICSFAQLICFYVMAL